MAVLIIALVSASWSVRVLFWVLCHRAVFSQASVAAKLFHHGGCCVHSRLQCAFDPATAPADTVPSEEDAVGGAHELVIEILVQQILARKVELEGAVVVLLVLPIYQRGVFVHGFRAQLGNEWRQLRVGCERT